MKVTKTTAFAAFAVLTAMPASAGPLTGAVNYVQNNLVTDIETLAIIGIAFLLFTMRFNWWAILAICGGIWVLANPTTLVAAFTGG